MRGAREIEKIPGLAGKNSSLAKLFNKRIITVVVGWKYIYGKQLIAKVVRKVKLRRGLNTKVVPFGQTGGYYFEKGNYYLQRNGLEKALLFFRKATEVEPENSLYHYNLACLLSRMNRLEKANKIFSHIVNKLDPSLTGCYFLMAINFGLMDEVNKARHYLNLYLQVSPLGEMAEEAEDILFALSEEDRETLPSGKNAMPANRVICVEEEKMLQRYRDNQDMRYVLWQALYQRNEQVAEKAIRLYSLLGNEGGKENLLEFVRNPWIKQRLRLKALLELKNMGIKGLVCVFMDGSLHDVDLSYYPLLAPRWLQSWQDVLECTLKNMRLSRCYNETFYEDAQAIWIDFLNNFYPRYPLIHKVETWSAALEYALSRYHLLSLTQKTLAGQYKVSTSSLSAKYKVINEVLNIQHRAYRNMLRYLTQREKE